jgi:acetylornithine deacetylase/succinyl-diaminopimelate desuccinylase-like protein
VEIQVDIRTVPGTTVADVDEHLRAALGDLAEQVEVSALAEHGDATESPRATPLWDALAGATQVAYPGAQLMPGLLVAATDARYFRARGAVAYGTGMFSRHVTWETFRRRFHGNDERVDVESLDLATEFWVHIAKAVCG